jgi:hypothetical protein
LGILVIARFCSLEHPIAARHDAHAGFAGLQAQIVGVYRTTILGAAIIALGIAIVAQLTGLELTVATLGIVVPVAGVPAVRDPEAEIVVIVAITVAVTGVGAVAAILLSDTRTTAFDARASAASRERRQEREKNQTRSGLDAAIGSKS